VHESHIKGCVGFEALRWKRKDRLWRLTPIVVSKEKGSWRGRGDAPSLPTRLEERNIGQGHEEGGVHGTHVTSG